MSWFNGFGAGSETTSAAPAVTAIEALTDRRGPEFMPALSPDGRSLAYVARDGDDLDIFLLRVGGQKPINLTADHTGWDIAPAFSPDGEQIAFSSEREGGGLFVMGATGESPRRVADEGTHPSWSPDGTRLVASTEQVDDPYSRQTRSRVFIVDLTDGSQRDLPVFKDGVGPRWSPDSELIAYWSELDGQRDLWTIRADGGDPTRVTEDAHTDWEPMWAENSTALYFHSDRGGSADLWRIPIDPASGAPTGSPTPVTIGVTPVWESSLSADGTRLVGSMRTTHTVIVAYPFDPVAGQVIGNPVTVLDAGTTLTQPSLSADGRTMAFRMTHPREIITTLDLESGARRRLTDDGFRNRGPAFSPDGQWIVLYSNRGGSYRLWRMRPEGTDLHQIYGVSASNPIWSSDGRRLVASSMNNWSFVTLAAPTPDADGSDEFWERVGERVEGFSPFAWSPDDRLLVGQSEHSGSFTIYDLEAGEFLKTATRGRNSGFTVSWLPDSERLIHWSPAEQQFMVWNVRTDESRPLTGMNGVPGNPVLSRDGRTLYVLEDRTDGEIWMLTLNGDRFN